MGRYRAILTDTDREYISGRADADGDEGRRFSSISRVRQRIREELPRDLVILREHHPDLFRELLGVVEEAKREASTPTVEATTATVVTDPPQPGPEPEPVAAGHPGRQADPDAGPTPIRDGNGHPTHDATAERERERDGDPREEAESILRGLNVPGEGPVLDARVDAVLELYDYLRAREGETVDTAELKNRTDADDVFYSSVESFWTNFVRSNTSQNRGMNCLEALPGVRSHGNGRYVYHGGRR